MWSMQTPFWPIWPTTVASRRLIINQQRQSEPTKNADRPSSRSATTDASQIQFSASPPCVHSQPTVFEKLACNAALGVLHRLDQAKLLQPILRQVIHRTGIMTKIEGTNAPIAQEEYIQRALAIVRAETTTTAARKSWDEISKTVRQRCHTPTDDNNSVTKPTDCSTRVEQHELFRAELEKAIGTKFTNDNKCVLLADGPAAFGKRYRLLAKEPQRIWIASWRFENDPTAVRICDELAQRARAGADVRLLVDGKVATREDHANTFNKVIAAGGKITYFQDSQAPLEGNHAKLCVIDNQIITGGLNYADCYSHGFDLANPDLRFGKWRDTDLLVKGPAVLDACKKFASLWNKYSTNADDHIDIDNLQPIGDPTTQSTVRTPPEVAAREYAARTFARPKVKDAAVTFLLTEPGPQCDESLLCAYYKLISGAQHQIDIENAYFIEMPPIQQALLAALKRGVRVRILTNSSDSIDEKAVATPIVASCHDLLLNGAEIYLKKGSTLHSKFMQVDEQFTIIGSFNLNPRSVQYDAECACIVDSAAFASGVRDIFTIDTDQEHAQRIGTLADLPKQSTVCSRLLMYRFYDHL
jgi:cardiolipin synthase A/B